MKKQTAVKGTYRGFYLCTEFNSTSAGPYRMMVLKGKDSDKVFYNKLYFGLKDSIFESLPALFSWMGLTKTGMQRSTYTNTVGHEPVGLLYFLCSNMCVEV